MCRGISQKIALFYFHIIICIESILSCHRIQINIKLNSFHLCLHMWNKRKFSLLHLIFFTSVVFLVFFYLCFFSCVHFIFEYAWKEWTRDKLNQIKLKSQTNIETFMSFFICSSCYISLLSVDSNLFDRTIYGQTWKLNLHCSESLIFDNWTNTKTMKFKKYRLRLTEKYFLFSLTRYFHSQIMIDAGGSEYI